MNKEIKSIILDYCQGKYHLEFDRDDLPEMIERISGVKVEKLEAENKRFREVLMDARRKFSIIDRCVDLNHESYNARVELISLFLKETEKKEGEG